MANMNGTRQFTHRAATLSDVPVISGLIAQAIAELQRPFLTDEQIASSRAIMGLDTQLIEDGTYYVVELEGTIVGCGGWSYRTTVYGSDTTGGRNVSRLDPTSDAARIRAMYTHPDYARRGIGRLILGLCETAARSSGFATAELVATLSGLPLYESSGYKPVGQFEDTRGGAAVPLVRMNKQL
jgi:GNAT superfamily N-acetyltransferase